LKYFLSTSFHIGAGGTQPRTSPTLDDATTMYVFRSTKVRTLLVKLM